MASVFLSYARDDAAKAKALATALQKAGHDVWWDRHIHGGSEFSGEIQAALNSAQVVLVLWSQASVGSEWVRDEATEGRDSGRLLPVALDESKAPLGFRQRQSIDMTGWSGRGHPPNFKPLLDALSVKVTGQSDPANAVDASKGRRRPSRTMIVGAAAAFLAVLLALGTWYYWEGKLARRPRPPQALTVALLPYATDSNDPATRQLAFAISKSLTHTLSQSRFKVTQLDSKPAPGDHSADFFMWVDVSRSHDMIVAAVRMEEAVHHIIVYSNRFEATPERSWMLPDQVGPQVAGSLSWTVPVLLLDRRHPSDPAVLASIFKQRETNPSRRIADDDLLSIQHYETLRRLAQTAPDSVVVQAVLAFDATYVLPQLPPSERAGALAVGRRAAARAHALAPEYADPFLAWCVLHSKARMIECENQIRAGMRADPDAPFGEWFMADLLNQAGRFDDALHMARYSLARDQYFPPKIGLALRLLEANGASADADALYRRATAWFPHFGDFIWSRVGGMIDRGDNDAIERFENQLGRANWPPDYQPLAPAVSAVRSKSVAALKSVCPTPVLDSVKSIFCMLGFARLGDNDGAFALAERLYPQRVGRTEAEEDRLWLNHASNSTEYLSGPGAAAMRRDPRYIALAQRVGLLAYWRSGRLPDFCRPPRPESICSQISAGS